MEEAAMCDRVAILDRGKIVALGKPEAARIVADRCEALAA